VSRFHQNVQPQSLDTEQAVIAACLLRPEIIRQVQPVLSSQHFYIKAHALIFEALCAVGRNADVVSVSDWLVYQTSTAGDDFPVIRCNHNCRMASHTGNETWTRLHSL
jgi:hypothetical protein